ncbi:hypothetical protein JCGZ_03713 [Jatropha curcas]|uniref:Uncharacterized protein n=1 Tax=Jatropha curcas TaxID=180498 RepID=A0A067KT83_JATCU|nr:hypothetical protein JCGZ_03713 [Jatropha curcas]
MEARMNEVLAAQRTALIAELGSGNGNGASTAGRDPGIQDLVDNGSIIPKSKPNISTNPLPTHGINAIVADQELIDPFELFLEMNDICVLDLNDLSEEVDAMTRSGRQYEPSSGQSP